MAALEQNFSASTTARPRAGSAEALSPADALPSVNFGFEELRDVMNKFTHRFDEYIATGRKRVLEERNQFKLNVAELQGTWCRASFSISSILLRKLPLPGFPKHSSQQPD